MHTISTQSQSNPADKYTPVQVAGLRLLARGDYALADITNRLIKKGFDRIEVNQDLQLLVTKKWINDARVAENIWEYYKGQKGDIFIKQKMQLKQVPRETISNFFENLHRGGNQNQGSQKLDPIDYKTIKRKLSNRYNIEDWGKLDPKVKNKIYGYLARQGFRDIGSVLGRLVAYE
ncbi:MAG: RecX family transcriptional regulator [Candidatus Parcubacteria bacterium]|nr:RecX family transcriptional regulator [Candidatus Paceibacterota bacterium]